MCMNNTIMLRPLVYVSVLLPLFVSGVLYGPQSKVTVLSGNEFDKAVKTYGVAIVEFYADWCGHCQSFAKEVEASAQALHGVMPVIAVQDRILAEKYSVKGFPTVKIFVGNGPSKDPTIYDYTGQRNREELVKFAMQHMNKMVKQRILSTSGSKESNESKTHIGTDIILTDKNFYSKVMSDNSNQWLIKFYAPWCGHCKQLEPEWNRLAKMSNELKVGSIDCTANTVIAGLFGVKGYPTIVLLTQGQKSADKAIIYNGVRKAENMLDFAKQHYKKLGPPELVDSVTELKKYCSGPLCLLFFVPHDKVKENLDMLSKVMLNNSSVPFKFCYTIGDKHKQWEVTLGINKYPAAIGLNMTKGVYSHMQNEFSKESINSFIEGIMGGKVSAGRLSQDLTDNLINNEL